MSNLFMQKPVKEYGTIHDFIKDSVRLTKEVLEPKLKKVEYERYPPIESRWYCVAIRKEPLIEELKLLDEVIVDMDDRMWNIYVGLSQTEKVTRLYIDLEPFTLGVLTDEHVPGPKKVFI